MTDTTDELVSAVTGDPIDPSEGFITDALGNHYTLEEYDFKVDKAVKVDGELTAAAIKELGLDED